VGTTVATAVGTTVGTAVGTIAGTLVGTTVGAAPRGRLIHTQATTIAARMIINTTIHVTTVWSSILILSSMLLSPHHAFCAHGDCFALCLQEKTITTGNLKELLKLLYDNTI